jgi:Cys-rich protein (TIGR01571 family)
MAATEVVKSLTQMVSRIIFQVIFAIIYKNRVVDRKRVLPPALTRPDSVGLPGPDFKYGLCSCFDDCDVCMHTFFCWQTRAADTYHSAGVLDFWLTLIIALFCSPCFAICVMPFKRSEIRNRLNGGSGGCACQDCLLSFFCGLCVIVQEARVVDEALGVKTKCCCNLTGVEETRVPLVGEVVSLAPPVQGQVTSAVVAMQPLSFQPPAHINAATQAMQVSSGNTAYAPVVAILQAQPAQALQVTGREVMFQPQPGIAVSQGQDTELEARNEYRPPKDGAHA